MTASLYAVRPHFYITDVGALASGRGEAYQVDAYGYGARAPAMAGAATAATDGDSSATYYNPAALASADEIRLDLGYGSQVHP